MKNELKPCPFCGSKDVQNVPFFDCFRVICRNCEVKTGIYSTKNNAAKEWNRRTNNEKTVQNIDRSRKTM